MTVLITLTLAGADTGPYDLFSDVDGFITPFETSIQRVDLLAGFLSANVPDFATVIKVLSKGNCVSFINLTIQEPTTTTTSTSSTTSTTSSSTTSTTTTLGVCTEYVFGTFSASTQSIKYTGCDGISETISFGGTGLYQEITICLIGSPVFPGETFIVANNGVCIIESTTTTTTILCVEFQATADESGGNVNYTPCSSVPGDEETRLLAPSEVFNFCALEGTVSTTGNVTIGIIGSC